MFSIIIPLYNKATYIEKTIQSVLAQTYQEFEIIVIDDGSMDESFVIAQKVLSYLSPLLGGWGVFQQQNQGVSTARNNGVKLAKYDYIAFLDADDTWEPSYLEEMKCLIETYPEAGIYGSAYYIVKNGRKRIAPIGVDSSFESGIINYFQVYAKTVCMPLWTGATIIRKSIFESEKGFKSTLKLGEDFDLWIRIAMKYPVAFLNKQLANYNQDVELANRAIGEKLYLPEEHMLFTDYWELNENSEFRYLFERLALYGLLPYYLAGKNKKEVQRILNSINWKRHGFKYRLKYILLPKKVILYWQELMKLASIFKTIFKSHNLR